MLEGLKPAESRVRRCKVNDFKAELDAKDYEILLQALEDTKTWTAFGLMKALRERGLVLTDSVIAKHRNKQCACFHR